MGSTNHGVQEITYEYFEEASAEDFNKRHLDIRPSGIYSGGYLTRVSDIEVTLSVFIAEIGDGDEQISVRTSAVATLNAASLDSGDIDPATPYIVLRWGFLEQQNNYVEVHAITSVAVAQADDIIVGKCVFSGSTLSSFSYTDRTFLNVQDLFLKVETLSLGTYVQLRAGRISDGSQSIFIPEQRVGPFSDPGGSNSRIDLVYIAADGTATILTGTAAVSPITPDYDNKLVVAEVTVVNGLPVITSDKIKDVRSFITAVSIPAGMIPEVYSGGESSTLSNGMIVKMGVASFGSSWGNKTITFATPFPTACLVAVCNGASNFAVDRNNHSDTHTLTKSSFQTYGAGGSVKWIAMGW